MKCVVTNQTNNYMSRLKREHQELEIEHQRIIDDYGEGPWYDIGDGLPIDKDSCIEYLDSNHGKDNYMLEDYTVNSIEDFKERFYHADY